VDVIMNKESTRETPSMVSFGDKMRFLGTDAYGKVSMNPKNTPHQLKRLLGKKFVDPDVQADIQRFPFKVTAAPDGGCLVHVTFCNEPASFTPEQLMAMLLVDLKKIAEVEGGIPVSDCVLSVPAFYTEAERYAMLNAAFIAGLNPLRLINETTATALAYGIYKTDLPETDPVNVLFFDMGHSSTQVRPFGEGGRGQCRRTGAAWTVDCCRAGSTQAGAHAGAAAAGAVGWELCGTLWRRAGACLTYAMIRTPHRSTPSMQFAHTHPPRPAPPTPSAPPLFPSLPPPPAHTHRCLWWPSSAVG
jgi:hypothetical protein